MKNKKIIIIFSIVLILVLVLGLTYAYFRTTLNGGDQIVKIDTLDLILNETSEGINLDTAIGVSDSKGMSLTPSTFTLVNRGDKAVDYTIYLDDMEIDNTDTRIDDRYLKYNLNKNGTDSGATLLTSIGANPNRILDSGTIEGGDTNTYSLNLWITDEVDGNYSGQVFKGKLRVEVSQEKGEPVADVLLADSANNINTSDPDQTFITGTDPNNYIWYSGKLWRAVSIDPDDNSVKLVTQWNISAISYNAEDNTAFDGSYMEEWLNDTSVDGFLGNLREPEKFIKMDSEWNVTETSATTKPAETTMVTAPVGLLNIYEYTMSYSGTDYSNGYLNNGIWWWCINSYDLFNIWNVDASGNSANSLPSGRLRGVRPSINLKSSVRIIDGDGTIDNPYRLNGDNEKDLSGTPLNTRYSGEYISFGAGENNLYRIVSHENGTGTKITSAEPLKKGVTFIESAFGDTVTFSRDNTIGIFLNNDYTNTENGYLTMEDIAMIEDSTTWYLGTVVDGASYKLAKYTNTTDNILTSSVTTAKVGLLRMGELMAGQFNVDDNNTTYWILTPSSSYHVRAANLGGNGFSGFPSSNYLGIKPAFNLKQNVIITGGDGTLQNPFTLSVN
ncbi:MAG TPA: hypothetical protein IAB45_05460 [Candidatus Onthousia faecavium]|nr:hypothetical protein [Candidatus Onthousia faecavium]